MGYRTFASMNVAIIGTGALAESYAALFAETGHEVTIAVKEGQGVADLPELENVQLDNIENACFADVIVIACPVNQVREMAYYLGDVRGKVLIDATANILTGCEEQVNSTGAISAITGSRHVVKIFDTLGYELLLKPLFGDAKRRLIMAGECKKTKEIVKIMSIDLGINEFSDFGNTDAIPLLDEMTKGWRTLALKAAHSQSAEIIED